MQIRVVLHILIYAWLDYADVSQTWLLNNRMGLILSTIFISSFKQIVLVPMWTFHTLKCLFCILFLLQLEPSDKWRRNHPSCQVQECQSHFSNLQDSLFKHNLFLKEKVLSVITWHACSHLVRFYCVQPCCLALGSPSN